MISIISCLLLGPVFAQLPSNTTTMPSNATTTFPSFNTTTTYTPSNYTTTTYTPSNYTTTTYTPSNYTTTYYPSNTTTIPGNMTTTPAPEFCTGHVCLPSENGFYAEGCCENSYCQCYGGVGYLKHCDGDGVFNEELQACDWDWHVPCCNTSMPTLMPEDKCQFATCEEDGIFSEGDCEDVFCQCTGGAGHLQHCHEGLYFNAEHSVCDWPWNIPGCLDSTPANPNTTTTATTTTTTTRTPEEQCSFNCTEQNGVFAEGCCEETYCQCFGGEGFLHYCPAGSIFNSELGFCDSPDSLYCCNTNGTTTSMPGTTTIAQNNTTTPTDECTFDCTSQPDGHYPEGDCLTTYCDCKDEEGTVLHCQMGAVFNEILGYCTNPENTIGC